LDQVEEVQEVVQEGVQEVDSEGSAAATRCARTFSTLLEQHDFHRIAPLFDSCSAYAMSEDMYISLAQAMLIYFPLLKMSTSFQGHLSVRAATDFLLKSSDILGYRAVLLACIKDKFQPPRTLNYFDGLIGPLSCKQMVPIEESLSALMMGFASGMAEVKETEWKRSDPKQPDRYERDPSRRGAHGVPVDEVDDILGDIAQLYSQGVWREEINEMLREAGFAASELSLLVLIAYARAFKKIFQMDNVRAITSGVDSTADTLLHRGAIVATAARAHVGTVFAILKRAERVSNQHIPQVFNRTMYGRVAMALLALAAIMVAMGKSASPHTAVQSILQIHYGTADTWQEEL
jgi:hypothetical protein